MNRRSILRRLLIFILIVVIGFIFIMYQQNDKYREIKIVSGHSFEYNKRGTIKKEFDGKSLSSFVTIALDRDNFTVELYNVNPSSDAFIINPNTGDMIPFKYGDNKFYTNTKLDKDITYGIIIDYNLTGSIRVVDTFKNIDEDKLFEEILYELSCGIE